MPGSRLRECELAMGSGGGLWTVVGVPERAVGKGKRGIAQSFSSGVTHGHSELKTALPPAPTHREASSQPPRGAVEPAPLGHQRRTAPHLALLHLPCGKGS